MIVSLVWWCAVSVCVSDVMMYECVSDLMMCCWCVCLWCDDVPLVTVFLLWCCVVGNCFSGVMMCRRWLCLCVTMCLWQLSLWCDNVSLIILLLWCGDLPWLSRNFLTHSLSTRKSSRTVHEHLTYYKERFTQNSWLVGRITSSHFYLFM